MGFNLKTEKERMKGVNMIFTHHPIQNQLRLYSTTVCLCHLGSSRTRKLDILQMKRDLVLGQRFQMSIIHTSLE